MTSPSSDDFSSPFLDPAWTVSGPAGIDASLAANTSDAFLALVTPDGNFDAWNTNNSARVMQAIGDDDFTLETRFLSTPSEQYQLQGILVEQDAQNWLRFDTYSDGQRLYAFVAVTVNGVSSPALQIEVPEGTANYLRVARQGDVWTYDYSNDGENWTTAGSITHNLTASSAGIFAGNVGNATGFTAQVDYIEFASDPITDEDGAFEPPNFAPVAGDDALTTDADTALTFAAADLLANDTDANPLTITAVTQPANGTLTDNGDGTFTYAPTVGYAGIDTFSYSVSDGDLTDQADVTISVAAQPAPAVSDDFSSPFLDPAWTVSGPAGIDASLAANTSDAFLALVTPDGNFDAWNTNNSARVMQAIGDDDFTLETRFLSTPSEQYQLQGILVEQDAQNWLRFDTYSDGLKLYAFVAVTANGSSTPGLKVEISEGTANYLRIVRQGDVWTYDYSNDGENWTTAGSITHNLTASSAGVLAGNVGNATGFTAQVDYIEFASDPITDEDGAFEPPNFAPVAGDDALTTDADTALTFAAADLLANDTDANPLTITAVTQPANGTLTDNGNGTFTYTPTVGYAGVDTFSYTVSDGDLTDQASVTISVAAEPAPAISDDFSSPLLDPAWTVSGPAGIDASLAANTSDAFLALVTPDGNFDAWNTNNSARVMQAIGDDDFTLETRFLSTPSEQYQLQGILVEQDAQNWLRFDTYSDGQRLYAFVAVTVNGVSSPALQIEVPEGTANYLRVARQGDVWTYDYSNDGENWTTAGSITHNLTASSAGIFAGNVGNATGFTAQVDYIEFASDPITDEDGAFELPNFAPVAGDDALTTDADTALTFAAADLLANDTDADPLTITAVTQPANGTLTDNGDGTFTYAPTVGYAGIDTFSYSVSDGDLTDQADVTVSVVDPSQSFNAISDDFAAAGLDPAWSFFGITGAAELGSDATDAFVEISSPAGTPVSASDYLTTPRLLQAVSNTDFQISAGFLTEPSVTFSEHGLLVVEDDYNFIRFDIAFTSDGTLRLIVGVTEQGATDYKLFQAVQSGSVTDFRITRIDDQWTFETSSDATNWSTAYTLNHAMTVSKVGLFAGTASWLGTSPGYTAQVDYFENSAMPIVDEDGTFVPPSTRPSQTTTSWSWTPPATSIFRSRPTCSQMTPTVTATL